MNLPLKSTDQNKLQQQLQFLHQLRRGETGAIFFIFVKINNEEIILPIMKQGLEITIRQYLGQCPIRTFIDSRTNTIDCTLKFIKINGGWNSTLRCINLHKSSKNQAGVLQYRMNINQIKTSENLISDRSADLANAFCGMKERAQGRTKNMNPTSHRANLISSVLQDRTQITRRLD